MIRFMFALRMFIAVMFEVSASALILAVRGVPVSQFSGMAPSVAIIIATQYLGLGFCIAMATHRSAAVTR
ncbi:hypothetical protein BH11PAT2_BH11PAT2_10260 [soil metagenome]